MADKGSQIGSDLKSAVKGIHGAGEALRGNINQTVDSAFNDRAGEAKNQAVAQKGLNEVETADARAQATHGGGGGGVRTGGVTTGGTTTGAGAHSGAVGNLQSNPAGTENLASEPTTRTERF